MGRSGSGITVKADRTRHHPTRFFSRRTGNKKPSERVRWATGKMIALNPCNKLHHGAINNVASQRAGGVDRRIHRIFLTP
jgi:hypothetical protein